MPDMQKTKSERLTAVLANVMPMKSEHLIHIKAKSERLNLLKMKSERLIYGASRCDIDEV